MPYQRSALTAPVTITPVGCSGLARKQSEFSDNSRELFVRHAMQAN
jgi:hypothetical protein